MNYLQHLKRQTEVFHYSLDANINAWRQSVVKAGQNWLFKHWTVSEVYYKLRTNELLLQLHTDMHSDYIVLWKTLQLITMKRWEQVLSYIQGIRSCTQESIQVSVEIGEEEKSGTDMSELVFVVSSPIPWLELMSCTTAVDGWWRWSGHAPVWKALLLVWPVTCALGGSASSWWTLRLDGPGSRSGRRRWTEGTCRGTRRSWENPRLLEPRRDSQLLNLLVNQVFVFKDEINLGCRRWSLQLLSVQHLPLQILDRLRDRTWNKEINIQENKTQLASYVYI